jgi:hypothetical protein
MESLLVSLLTADTMPTCHDGIMMENIGDNAENYFHLPRPSPQMFQVHVTFLLSILVTIADALMMRRLEFCYFNRDDGAGVEPPLRSMT